MPGGTARPWRGMRSTGPLVLMLSLLVVSSAACGSSSPSAGTTAGGSSAPTGSTKTPPTTGSAPTVPATGAYLGAWLHPVAPGTGGSAFAVEQQSVPALQARTGRPLAVLHVFAPWRLPAPVDSLAAVAANGSTPLLDWGCGVSGDEIASGTDDAQITAYARALKSYGGPVLLRWCWEMNLVRAHQSVGGPDAFVAAWRHIWTVFHHVGVPNVVFVWCPAVAGVDPAPYYPGDGYVDWIGIDGYDRTGTATFSSLFGAFYTEWVGHDRPMMVAETGAQPPDQAAYVASIGTGAPGMPQVKAVVYFDAIGPDGSWVLQGPGLAAFAALAHQPYFAPG